MVDKKIVLRFPKRLVDRPIVSHLIKDHDLEFTILKASVTQDEEGLMVLELKGKQEEYDKGIAYLKQAGVILESLSQDVTRNEARCTHCGACITVCPVGAFELDMITRQTSFHDKKCIGCGICIKTCPPRAMELHF